jgi:hypothetical protein
MENAKQLSYLGSDSDFTKDLSNYVDKFGFGNFKINESTYKKGALVRVICAFEPSIVYIDLTIIQDVNDLLNEVIYIKRNKVLKKILIVAIFPDQASMEANRILLTSGFQLFFIKGAETMSLFRDSFYIAYDSIADFPAFARAKKIDKNINVGVCATLYSISDASFILETDIDLPSDSVNMKLPVFPDLTNVEFLIKDRSDIMVNYPMTTSYVIELPLAGPWTEVSTNFLQHDTLDTWKEFNVEMLAHDPAFIKVFSRGLSLVNEIFEFYDSSLLHLSFDDGLNHQLLVDELTCRKPALIFFEYDTDSDELNLNRLNDLTALISSVLDPAPIVICTNNPSKTQAIQKLLNFPTILCFEKPLTGKIYSLLTNRFLEKRKEHDVLKDSIFKPSALNRALDVKFEVLLTSLSEHEITFFCSVPLPMYTLLHFTLPVEFVATIIPPIYEVTHRAESNQYMAFINGVDESGLELIRKFINQILYNPLSDYSETTISQVLRKMKSKMKSEEALVPTVVLENDKKTEIIKKDVSVETRFKGKSKL